MKARAIDTKLVRHLQFSIQDALSSPGEKLEREHKLKTAMALTNNDHEPIRLVIKLFTGELVETYSDLIDWEDDYVEIHGGVDIPLKAIVDIGV